MGNYLTTTLKCNKLSCNLSIITYQQVIIYNYPIPYDQLMEHIKSHVLNNYFVTSYHSGNYTYVIYQGCECCVKEDLKKYFKYDKNGFSRFRINY
jgi:hypothetical protein